MPSFVEDITAAVDAIGVEAPGVVIGIGLTEWDSVEQRDEFLAFITSKRERGVSG